MLDQKDLIKKVKNYNKFLNPETLSKAYTFALKAHKNQKRDAGEPFIIHPIAVADILTDLRLDSATITTGLLHDTIEDTKITKIQKWKVRIKEDPYNRHQDLKPDWYGFKRIPRVPDSFEHCNLW